MKAASTRGRSNSAATTNTTTYHPPVPPIPSKLSSGTALQPPSPLNPTSSTHSSSLLSSSSSTKSKSKSKSTNILSSSRMSILPTKVKLHSLALGLGRRQQADVPPSSFASSSSSSDPNLPPPNTKTPLLTLSFSSRSFLDSIVSDADAVKEKDRDPLYVFNTVGTSTTISRWDGSRTSPAGKDRNVKDREASFHKMATIKWPRALPTKMGKDYTDGVLIQMKNARWYGGETLLKLGSNPNASRKFSIPNYSHPMKWKRYGHTYWCTTPTVKGPIATLSTAKSLPSVGPSNSHPNLHPQPNSHSQQPGLTMTVYETLHDKYDPNGLTAFRGVSILLLDYLLVTAMLLVTDLQEWMLVRKADDHEAGQVQGVGGGSGEGFGGGVGANMGVGVDGQGPARARGGIIIGQGTGVLGGEEVPFRSDARIRKIMYGEPIFPKGAGPVGSSEDRERDDHEDEDDETRRLERQRPPTPPTPGSGAGMPTFLPHRVRGITTGTLLPSMTDSSEEEEEEEEDLPSEYQFEDESSFVGRARAESIAISSPASASGPTHTSLDPSYYYPPVPVPPLPLKYAKSFNSFSLSNDGSAPTRALSASTSASQPSTPLSASFGASTSTSSSASHYQSNSNNHSSSRRPPIPPIPPLPTSLPPYLQNVDPISRPRSSPPLQAHQHTHSRTHSHTNTTSSPSSPSPSYSPRSDSLHHGHHVQTMSTVSTSSGSGQSATNHSEAYTHSHLSGIGMGRRESVRSYGSAASASASTSPSIYGSGSGSVAGVTTTTTTKRPLPRPPPLPPSVSSGSHINLIPPTATTTTVVTPPRPQRSLPPTPGFALNPNVAHTGPPPPPSSVPTSSSPPSSPTNPSHPPSHSYPYPFNPNAYPYPYPYPYPPPPPNITANANANQNGIPYAYPPYAYPYPYVYPLPPGAAHDVHARQPPITKASQEDLASYVHLLTTGSPPVPASSGPRSESTSPGHGEVVNEGGSASNRRASNGNGERQENQEGNGERQLPVEPIPSSSIYDVPPPAYNTIVFGSHPLPPPPPDSPPRPHPSSYAYPYPYPLVPVSVMQRHPVQMRSMSMPDTSLGAAGPGHRPTEVDRARERRPTAPDLLLMGIGGGSGSDMGRAARVDGRGGEATVVQEQQGPQDQLREPEEVDSPQEERQEEEQQQRKQEEEHLIQNQHDQIVWGEGLDGV